MLDGARVPVLALALALTVAGCSGDDEPDEMTSGDAASAVPSASASASVDPDPVSPRDLPDVPTVEREGSAIADLELGDCTTGQGRRTVTGSLTSSRTGEHDFLVTVSWTTAAGDLRGRGFEVFRDVGKGDSLDVEIAAKVAEGATQCVPGVVYGSVTG